MTVMMPTIKDVARLANTSKSTVSRFLNGKPVKKDTELALRKAIEELNYHPNMNARRLVLNRTQVVGIVVEDISNNFFTPILKGIRDEFDRKGYECVFYTWNLNRRREVDFMKLLYEEQVDGLIFVSFTRRSREDVRLMCDAPFPVVLIGDHAGVNEIYSIDVDNANGVHEVVNYLYRIGHRKIAHIAGPEHAGAGLEREHGFREAMLNHGISADLALIVQSDWTHQGGYNAMKALLEVGGFTAVVASNDESAIGAIGAAHEHGYSIPRDFSIVGFDDIGISQWIYPPLTTVRQPFQETGRRAAEVLYRAMVDEETTAAPRILLKPELVIRNSCLHVQTDG